MNLWELLSSYAKLSNKFVVRIYGGFLSPSTIDEINSELSKKFGISIETDNNNFFLFDNAEHALKLAKFFSENEKYIEDFVVDVFNPKGELIFQA